MSDDDIKRKISQAEFHLEKLREPESQLAAESYFAAFIAAARSAVMYVHEWQLANGRAKNERDWSVINAWEKALPAADHDGWRAVVDLRNTDIHKVPVVPTETWQGGWFGGIHGGWFGGWFGETAAQTVAHPDTGTRVEILDLAECALRVVKQLLLDYMTL
jgi:hypothetical protein